MATNLFPFTRASVTIYPRSSEPTTYDTVPIAFIDKENGIEATNPSWLFMDGLYQTHEILLPDQYSTVEKGIEDALNLGNNDGEFRFSDSDNVVRWNLNPVDNENDERVLPAPAPAPLTIEQAFIEARKYINPGKSLMVSIQVWDAPDQSNSQIGLWDGDTHHYGTSLRQALDRLISVHTDTSAKDFAVEAQRIATEAEQIISNQQH